jgi:hypothetical protein
VDGRGQNSTVATREPGGQGADSGEIDLVRDWIVGTAAAAGGSVDRVRVRLTALRGGAGQLGEARLLRRARPLRVQVLARTRPDAGLALVGRLAGRIESLAAGCALGPRPSSAVRRSRCPSQAGARWSG